MKRHLIIYAKRPIAHYAKTRLGAEIGHEQAAGIYARLLYSLLLDVIDASFRDTILELAVAAPADRAVFSAAFPELMVRPQVAGGLGARMATSFTEAFEKGADSVVLAGSDVPGLNAALLAEAFGALEDCRFHEAIPGVIGPTVDGGYYLIGMRAPGAPLFDGIAWSTANVLAQTEALARDHRVLLTQLSKLADIDIRADYEAWRRALEKACPSTETTALSLGGSITGAKVKRIDE